MWWFIYHCSGVSCSTGGGNPELLTSFFWVPSHSPFSSFCRATVCPSLTAACLCLSLPHYSQTALLWLHGVKEGRNDSGSLEQERPANSPSYSLGFLSPAFCCSPALAPSHCRAASSLPLSLSVPPQIQTLWGSTAPTTPWSEGWWPSWSLSLCV